MLLIVPSSSILARIVRAGTPMASEKRSHRAGQLERHVLAPRRRGVGARPPDVGALPHGGGGGFLFVFRLTPPHGGRLLALQLPLLAAAQGGCRPLLFAHRDDAAARRGGDAPGRSATALPDGGSRRRLLARRGLGGFGGNPPLLVLAEVLGKRLGARFAGADGVLGELDVGLLRGRLRRLWPHRRPRRRGQRRQLDGRRFPFLPFLLFRARLSSLGRDSLGGRPARGGASSGFFFTAGGFSGREGSTGILLGPVPAGAM